MRHKSQKRSGSDRVSKRPQLRQMVVEWEGGEVERKEGVSQEEEMGRRSLDEAKAWTYFGDNHRKSWFYTKVRAIFRPIKPANFEQNKTRDEPPSVARHFGHYR